MRTETAPFRDCVRPGVGLPWRRELDLPDREIVYYSDEVQVELTRKRLADVQRHRAEGDCDEDSR